MSYSKTDVYSGWKVAHHRDRLDALKKGKFIVPTQIQIDPINACNHNCLYCFYRGRMAITQKISLNELFNKNQIMPTRRICELIEEFKECGVNAIPITGGGEPALHPDFLKILKAVLRNKLETSLITNGSLLTDKMIKSLNSKGVKWIRFSMDAFYKKTYQKLQQPARKNEYEAVIDNLRKVIKNKHPETIVGVSFVINPLNWREIVKFTEFARELGCDNVRISLAYTYLKDRLHKPYWEKIQPLFIEAKKFETEDFRVFIMKERFQDLALQKKTYDICYFQQFSTCIGADMNLYPCCTLKYGKGAALGNLLEHSFKEVWFGEQRRKWLERKATLCPNCWFDRPNEFIEYLLLKNPPHVNFI